VLQHYVAAYGWRATYTGMGFFCLAVMLPLITVLRRPAPTLFAPAQASTAPGSAAAPAPSHPERPLGLSPTALQTLLGIAGVSCCVAMSMPQVHIVAYCGDLGYGAARGAEMLSLMLGMGIASRLISGWISDRIGGLKTLLLGSVLQGIALLGFLVADGLASLYIIAGMFGLFQGGIVPSYALIVREHFDPKEVGSRVGTVLMCSLYGMALGGWLSGAIFDMTGSYRAAFLNGTAWNLVNVAIVLFLLSRTRGPRRFTAARPYMTTGSRG
jgi:MFS family permease